MEEKSSLTKNYIVRYSFLSRIWNNTCMGKLVDIFTVAALVITIASLIFLAIATKQAIGPELLPSLERARTRGAIPANR